MTRLFRFFCLTSLSFIYSLGYADNIKCPNVPVTLGQCVNVGSYELFMNVAGTKGPIVVFESGQGDTSHIWNKVTPVVSQFARAVTYDRVNLGYSQIGTTKPLLAKQIAENLHTLLHTANLLPPYILVGHSSGGMYMQMFARLYPKEISGVIFVDAASPKQTLTGMVPKTSPAYEEALGFPASQQQVNHAPPFPHVPIIVLTATYHGFKDPTTILHTLTTSGHPITMTEGQNQVLWQGWQNQLVQLSPYSTHIYAYDSDHHIQIFQTNLVIDAIYTMIKQQKNKIMLPRK